MRLVFDILLESVTHYATQKIAIFYKESLNHL